MILLRVIENLIVMIIHIKNMICLRCKIVVNNILESFGIEAAEIRIGSITLREKLPAFRLRQLNQALKETGLELIFDKKLLLVHKIKTIINELIHFSNEPLLLKFSCYLSNRLNYNYTYLSNLFKKLTGNTIEHYIIQQKIEKTKVMLIEDDLSLSEIAFRLNYSSVGHLSAQFKKITGYGAREYKLACQDANTGMISRMAV